VKKMYRSDTEYRNILIAAASKRMKTEYARNVSFRYRTIANARRRINIKFASDPKYRLKLICAASKRIKAQYSGNSVYRQNCIRTSQKRKVASAISAKGNIDNVVAKFQSEICEGPEYVCVCCHRNLYRQSVTKYNPLIFKKISNNIKIRIDKATPILAVIQIDYICATCKYHLIRGKVPPQSAINGLILDKIPDDINCLSELESILISQRIMFMKILALSRGKQHAIHGSMVNISVNVISTVKNLPRPLSAVGLVPLELKRKIEYKGHAWHQFVRPQAVRIALSRLIEINYLYANITLNDSWQNVEESDDQEIINSLSGRNKHADHDSDVEQSSDDHEIEDEIFESKVAGLKYSTCLQPTEPQLAGATKFF